MQNARAGSEGTGPAGTVIVQIQATLAIAVLPEVQPGTTHLVGARRDRGSRVDDLGGGRGRRLGRRGGRDRRHRYRGERSGHRDP